MKKIILIAICLLSFAGSSFGELYEGIDYNVSYRQTPRGYADVLHVNFMSIMPNPAVAVEILQKQLAVYGSRSKGKNIIGSAWHTISGDQRDLRKMKFTETLGAYVWMGGSKRVVTFTNYLYLLKRANRNKGRG
jgi:hypothetical protein